jgi:hypothetical protein
MFPRAQLKPEKQKAAFPLSVIGQLFHRQRIVASNEVGSVAVNGDGAGSAQYGFGCSATGQRDRFQSGLGRSFDVEPRVAHRDRFVRCDAIQFLQRAVKMSGAGLERPASSALV